MSRYQAVDPVQLNANLTSIADAIRAKNGTTDTLAFPDGFVNAINETPDYLEMRITDELTNYSNDKIAGVTEYGFAYCDNLESVNLPNVNFINMYAFWNDSLLAEVNIPKVHTIGASAFERCSSIAKLDLPAVTNIGSYAFSEASALITLILRKTDTVCTLNNANAFDNTPISTGTGYIYVPSAMVDQYKAAENWSTFANQIRAIEDYPDITG